MVGRCRYRDYGIQDLEPAHAAHIWLWGPLPSFSGWPDSVGEHIGWTGTGNSVILRKFPLHFGNGTKERSGSAK